MKKRSNKRRPRKSDQEPQGGFFDSTDNLPDEQREELESTLNLLKGRIDEYLKCFMVLGYSIDGLPVLMISGKTQQDLDSLNLALQRFIVQNMGGPMGGEDVSQPHRH
jgi:hypothetical protein